MKDPSGLKDRLRKDPSGSKVERAHRLVSRAAHEYSDYNASNDHDHTDSHYSSAVDKSKQVAVAVCG